MTNFKYWYEHIADMPERDEDGKWYDLEDGLAYDPSYDYQDTKQRYVANTKIKELRNVAKAFGGKALKGTTKQKAWAEKIRASFLTQVTAVQAEILCFLSLTEHSKFWIENRELKSEVMGNHIEKAAELIKKINGLGATAEKSLVTDEKRTVIDSTKYDALMKERDVLIDELNSLFNYKSA